MYPHGGPAQGPALPARCELGGDRQSRETRGKTVPAGWALAGAQGQLLPCGHGRQNLRKPSQPQTAQGRGTEARHRAGRKLVLTRLPSEGADLWSWLSREHRHTWLSQWCPGRRLCDPDARSPLAEPVCMRGRRRDSCRKQVLTVRVRLCGTLGGAGKRSVAGRQVALGTLCCSLWGRGRLRCLPPSRHGPPVPAVCTVGGRGPSWGSSRFWSSHMGSAVACVWLSRAQQRCEEERGCPGRTGGGPGSE